jgi:hypothetical protein
VRLISFALVCAGCRGSPAVEGVPDVARPAEIGGSADVPRSSTPRPTLLTQPSWTTLDEPAGRAPCDFSRAFRGTVGQRKMSLVIRRDAAAAKLLTGESHDDREGEASTLSGTLEANGFSLLDSAGGSFRGVCDELTGNLSGTFTLGQASSLFTFTPRPDDWPGLYQVLVEVDAESHNPACARVGKRDEPVALSEYETCPPRDPAKRKAFYEDVPNAGCRLRETSFRVFGLADEQVEKKLNAELSSSQGDAAQTRACKTAPQSEDHSMSIVDVRASVLVVTTFHSIDEGGIHPRNSTGPTKTLDLISGDVVRLEHAIVDVEKLKAPAADCVGLYEVFAGDAAPAEMPAVAPARCGEEASARFLWGCPDHETPTLIVTGAGVIIGQSGNPHATIALEGQGPLLPWSVLLRSGALRQGSPIERLWKGVPPAPAEAPACTSAYEGDRWRRWSVE